MRLRQKRARARRKLYALQARTVTCGFTLRNWRVRKDGRTYNVVAETERDAIKQAGVV